MKKAFSLLVILLLITLIHSSCDKNMVYDQFQRIDDNTWRWDEPLDFTFTMDDTVGIHQILIQLRHTTEYPLSNLYMLVHVKGPSGQQLTDTINFVLAENSGKWIGKGVGNIREIGYRYKKGTRFPEQGDYTISIEQAMRLPELPVSEIGVRVEKYHP
jgi:gliding motility-associated lipoprotein GldH